MLKKRTLSSVVKNNIESYPYIRSSLTDGLVNYSALARKLKGEINLQMDSNINEESIIVSIKRYADELSKTIISQDIPTIISNTTISTTEDVACLLLESRENLEEIKDILHNSEWNLDEIRFIMQAASKVFVLLNKEKMNDLIQKLPESEMVLKNDIAMISIKIPTGHYNSYGLFHEFTNIFAKKGINIEQSITLTPYIHFIIDEAHLNEALESLKDLIKISKEIVKKRNSH